MGEPKVLVQSRKYIRGRVTALFNQRDSFSALSQLDRDIKKSTLGDYLADLKEYNTLIRKSKWSDDDDDEDGMEKDLKEWDEQFTKNKLSFMFDILRFRCYTQRKLFGILLIQTEIRL